MKTFGGTHVVPIGQSCTAQEQRNHKCKYQSVQANLTFKQRVGEVTLSDAKRADKPEYLKPGPANRERHHPAQIERQSEKTDGNEEQRCGRECPKPLAGRQFRRRLIIGGRWHHVVTGSGWCAQLAGIVYQFAHPADRVFQPDKHRFTY